MHAYTFLVLGANTTFHTNSYMLLGFLLGSSFYDSCLIGGLVPKIDSILGTNPPRMNPRSVCIYIRCKNSMPSQVLGFMDSKRFFTLQRWHMQQYSLIAQVKLNIIVYTTKYISLQLKLLAAYLHHITLALSATLCDTYTFDQYDVQYS